MGLVTRIRALNAVQLAWVAEDPDHRCAGLLVEDLAVWASMGVSSVEEFDRYLLVSEYSDAHKDAYGFRSRRDLSSVSNSDLEAELVVLRKYASERAVREAEELALEVEWLEKREKEEREAAANRAWEEKWGVHYERLGV